MTQPSRIRPVPAVPMTPADVVSCPACRHLLRVPADWLGQPVRCPECKATFRANPGGKDAELLADAVAPAADLRPPGRVDWMLLLPAFGLMLCGVVGVAVDGYMTLDGENTRARIMAGMADVRAKGFPLDPANDAASAEATVRLLPVFAAMSAVVFAGGLAIVCRRAYRLAQLACGLAALNVANGCCIPGAVFGAWAFVMLLSQEGRAHFGR